MHTSPRLGLQIVDGTDDVSAYPPVDDQAKGIIDAVTPLGKAVNIVASESRTNTAYGKLTTPDQVTGVILPANGLIAVFYQATWQESVAGAGRAAVFLNGNQLLIGAQTGVFAQAAATGATTITAQNTPLFSMATGLATFGNSANLPTGYPGDSTTGQTIGIGTDNSNGIGQDIGGTLEPFNAPAGGPCYIFGLPAGTYTVSVQFKSSSGSVTALNRKLWVLVLPFGG